MCNYNQLKQPQKKKCFDIKINSEQIYSSSPDIMHLIKSETKEQDNNQNDQNQRR